jgi:hypothetical protein
MPSISAAAFVLISAGSHDNAIAMRGANAGINAGPGGETNHLPEPRGVGLLHRGVS